MPTKKPTGKTPANNAGSDVVDEPTDAVGDPTTDAEIRTFKSGDLPSIANVADDGPRIGNIADVAFFSGLFPGETPATLAIRLLAGQSLGLDAAQALFDLETGPGPTVRYRPAGRTFEQASDDVEATKAANREALKNSDDRLTPEPALDRRPKCPRCGSKAPKLHPAVQHEGEVSVCPDPFHNDGSNVVQLPSPPAMSADPSKVPAGSSQKIDDSANKRPTPNPDAISVAEGDKNQPGDAQGSPSGGSDDPGTLKQSLDVADAGADVANVTADVVAAWRSALSEMLTDLGADVVEKLKTFDAAPLPQRRKIFDDMRAHYKKKIDGLREFVVGRLAEDGKTTPEAQKGFYLFAEVPLEIDAWTYQDADRAAKAIVDFLKSKK